MFTVICRLGLQLVLHDDRINSTAYIQYVLGPNIRRLPCGQAELRIQAVRGRQFSARCPPPI
jgi:hypothetical protein